MRNVVINGTKFSVFERDGVKYLCTGSPTGKLKFAWSGEVADYYTVAGATSVVSGNCDIDELYEKWLEATEFYRSIGISF